MSYFPGSHGSVNFEAKELVWEQGGVKQRVPWSEIRSVTSGVEGAVVHWGEQSLLIPKDVVWFEFVVEDIISKARTANPGYEGPAPVTKTRELKLPSDRQGQSSYTRRAQRFYKERCPGYQEFMAFLTANPEWVFNEDTYYECSMAMCSGSPVDEGYSSDLVIPPNEQWYRRFEKKVGGGLRSGRELLEVLKAIEP